MIIQGDAMQIPLADKSVQCVVTSPPYWGLRDFGTATWVGGDEGCDHKPPIREHGVYKNGQGQAYQSSNTNWDHPHKSYDANCGKCGATRIDSQIGLEPTPEEYVAKIVAVFAEVWRVLRDDGTCWVNLGDSYAQGGKHRDEHEANIGEQKRIERQKIRDDDSGVYAVPTGWGKRGDRAALTAVGNLKPKDLVGIPWRVAFALQAAGWYLRSDIIWSKPNPMPESVTDRPTKAHEYIFLLTKRERYYFDQDAVREEHQEPWRSGNEENARNRPDESLETGRPRSFGWEKRVYNPAGRNIRTVWEIATQPYPEAHFATFPEEIAVRCIKAGTSEKGACKECGAPWERVTERGELFAAKGRETSTHGQKGNANKDNGWNDDNWKPGHSYESKTTGWQPTCKHEAPTVPCVVLDPFSGAGTVPLVADKLNRRGIGLELKADYCRMAHYRCYDDAPLLAAL